MFLRKFLTVVCFLAALCASGRIAFSEEEGGATLTPLHRAAYEGQVGEVRKLLEAGADVMARTDRQVTPLHLAVLQGHLEVVEVLLEHKADPEAKDGQGLTPIVLARRGGNPVLLNMLLKAAGLPTEDESPMENPLTESSSESAPLGKDAYGKVGVTGTIETLWHDTRVGGKVDTSYETEEIYDQTSISLRGLLETPSGDTTKRYQWNFKIRNSSKLNEEEWVVERAAGSIERPDMTLDYWDTRPELSPYVLTGRQIRGLSFGLPSHKKDLFQAILGYDPIVSNAFGVKRQVFGVGYTHQKAWGGLELGVQALHNEDNNSLDGFSPAATGWTGSVTMDGPIGRKVKLRSEFARSEPRTGAVAGAQVVELASQGKHSLWRASMENVDSDFFSPMATPTTGLDETKASYVLMVNRYLTLTLTHKRRKLPSDRLKESLVGIRVTPSQRRSRLAIELKWIPRRAVNVVGRTHINSYSLGFTDKFGINQVQIDLLNEDRDREGLASQDKKEYQFTVNTFLSEKLSLKNRYRRYAQQGLARERYFDTSLDWEPRDWHSMEFRHTYKDDRLGEGDRDEWSLRYGWLNPNTNMEYNFEWRRERQKTFTNRHVEAKIGLTF